MLATAVELRASFIDNQSEPWSELCRIGWGQWLETVVRSVDSRGRLFSYSAAPPAAFNPCGLDSPLDDWRLALVQFEVDNLPRFRFLSRQFPLDLLLELLFGHLPTFVQPGCTIRSLLANFASSNPFAQPSSFNCFLACGPVPTVAPKMNVLLRPFCILLLPGRGRELAENFLSVLVNQETPCRSSADRWALAGRGIATANFLSAHRSRSTNRD